MKLVFALLLLPSVLFGACRSGCFDYRGTCTCEIQPNKADEKDFVKPSDEKPPKNVQPCWQTGLCTVVDAPNMASEDAKWDAEKLAADREGKRSAGIE